MLIGIDGNEANVQNRVGSNIYSFELLRLFHRTDKKNKFIVYLKEKPLADMPKENDRWQYQLVKPRRFSTQFGLPLKLFFHRPRPDVFFTPGHYLPRWSPCPTVMAILDIAYIDFPQMFRKKDLWQLKRWTERSTKKAAKILTISQSSKNAIIGYHHLKPAKVIVTYPGSRMITNPKKVDLKKYGIQGDFVLHVGTLQPRKNLPKLIEAFSRLENQKLKLVVLGKKGWLYDQIFEKAKKLGLEKRVIFTGFVPDEDLPTFFQKAQCFVLVSLYEGFGLPALEAMHYDCPVVASNVSSLPEVVGQAGILVDPENVKEITRGIEKAIKNRKKLIVKGRQQAKKFSWEKCARETLEVLETVGGKK